MEEFTALIAWAAQALAAWRQANPILAEGVSFACRLLAPMLTLLILVRTIRSLRGVGCAGPAQRGEGALDPLGKHHGPLSLR